MTIINRIKEGMLDEVVAGTAGDITSGVSSGIGGGSGASNFVGDAAYTGISLSQYNNRKQQWQNEQNSNVIDGAISGVAGGLAEETAKDFGVSDKLAGAVGLTSTVAAIGALENQPIQQAITTNDNNIENQKPTNAIANAAYQGVMNTPLAIGRGR